MPDSSNLYTAFFEHPNGLCGEQDKAALLSEIETEETRLHLIALGCILDPTPRQDGWEELAALDGHWLADSSQVAYKRSQEVGQALHQARIRAPKHAARVWWQICRGVQGRFKGSFRALFEANHDHAIKIQQYLGESRTTFPVLSAPVTSARWLDLVHRVGGIELADWGALRLEVPDSLKEPAGLFDLDQEQLHPALALALKVWESGCEGRDADGCGLEECPRR